MLIRQNLIKFSGDLSNWLNSLDLLEESDRLKIERIGNFIPLDVETKMRRSLNSKVDEDCKILLRKLLSSCNGISLEKLGVNLEQDEENKFCAFSVLVKLKLARIDKSEETLKALPIAFNENVQYLIGLKSIH